MGGNGENLSITVVYLGGNGDKHNSYLPGWKKNLRITVVFHGRNGENQSKTDFSLGGNGVNLLSVSAPLKVITKACLYNTDPLKPHFYIVKDEFTRLYIIFRIPAHQHRLWVLVRTTSPRQF